MPRSQRWMLSVPRSTEHKRIATWLHVEVQVRECQEFMERSRRRITMFDEDRASEVGFVGEGGATFGATPGTTFSATSLFFFAKKRIESVNKHALHKIDCSSHVTSGPEVTTTARHIWCGWCGPVRTSMLVRRCMPECTSTSCRCKRCKRSSLIANHGGRVAVATATHQASSRGQTARPTFKMLCCTVPLRRLPNSRRWLQKPRPQCRHLSISPRWSRAW